MTKELLASTLDGLYGHALRNMEGEMPTKIRGEAERIDWFGRESFTAGFLYGMRAGMGVTEELHDGEE